MVFFLDLSTMFFNPIFDSDYIRIDALFGVQPSALAAIVLAEIPPLLWICLVVYFVLPLAQAFLAAREARTSGRSWGILPAFVVAAIVGYVLYALMPAIGPSAHLGDDFPMLNVPLYDLAARPNVDDESIRGAMPSLHITWAALLCLASIRMPGHVQAATAAFFVLTFLATLGLGMHYLIDLIVAIPLASSRPLPDRHAVAKRALCGRHRRRGPARRLGRHHPHRIRHGRECRMDCAGDDRDLRLAALSRLAPRTCRRRLGRSAFAGCHLTAPLAFDPGRR